MCKPLPAEKLSFGPVHGGAKFNLLAPVIPLIRARTGAH
jgi:hypothetical protein